MMRGNSRDREQAIQRVYTLNRGIICSYIIANSGSEEQAKDVFQESVIALYENVRDGKFKADSSLSTYLFSIAKFKWFNQIKKDSIRSGHHQKAQLKEEFDPGPLAQLVQTEAKERILGVLEGLGERCKQILVESLYHNASMKEIAKSLSFSSEQVVRNTKYKCLKKLKELIVERPQLIKILRTDEN